MNDAMNASRGNLVDLASYRILKTGLWTICRGLNIVC